ncbi:MAG: hypothetical protein A3F95_03050 [Candidatus Nealsonbacteria bacterium RIFCSPLOWO2_12_FULL_39_31]|uniref:Beta propeller domain-containing protein n=3 Tax=Candidatus Nealsoniibacteriota TaxID=1817911 RepID=A0A1G2EK94_9BACT|nr:MAG: hypothetical protein US88_C0004G0008 [Parcubacteria group bacterium GW2011_GWA2_38_27]KKQ97314.1 MAG: hypothetical protein UT22_C0013G0010 [Parcubacteria group bacterium GW2011_GWC2_39_11]OGZ19429.1 MAG: hypothetical protein A2626_02405 [Candidatus Nealsonbacteria bacterium RIFCSPHIGHO2_01_FULL_38_55]OGZ20597.1 MAG: hypothetical protein A2W55_01625 [Candidatus Nealsonbacteria bacterium RIFCSPHIGHO2_02_38_10]OGZ22407.1 MAG: hypothetical protein A3E18_00515 [Candidatus Nealsonbacteria bac
MKKTIDQKFAIFSITALAVIIAFVAIISYRSLPSIDLSFLDQIGYSLFGNSNDEAKNKAGIKKFSSEREFKAYLEGNNQRYGFGGRGGMALQEAVPTASAKAIGATGESIQRVSETNVQVLGIDEPDIVKTNGKEIYFSQSYSYRYLLGGPVFYEKGLMPPSYQETTKIIKALPIADLSVVEEIDKAGDLILSGNNLAIFSGEKIYGYDISNPKSPKNKWTADLEGYIAASRLYDGRIYLISVNSVGGDQPCPIKPMAVDGKSIEVKCADIYYPGEGVAVDVVFTAIILNPADGAVEKKISFVGSSGSSIVYMSAQNIFITYSYPGDLVKFIYNFINDDCKDIIPGWLSEKLGKLIGYDISNMAKTTELQVLLDKYFYSLDKDEQLKIQNELINRMNIYHNEHKRDLEKTGIVKIALNEFDVSAAGHVPGQLLNQFSLDEYQGNLRVATTVGNNFWGFGIIGGGGESASDVYILNGNLNIVGFVKDLGLDEKIYSARFIGDKGYLVTFKQIDPFFVLDLSDPKNPKVSGQLKIPGYSSYLHPINENIILGVGKEDSQVKLSLFDVRAPENPVEISKYILNEYWSDILNTYHAFLLDKKQGIFFMPGSSGGYVFSYKENKFSLEKAVSGISAQRAIYINDYLYIIGRDKIIVLDETNWQKVGSLGF